MKKLVAIISLVSVTSLSYSWERRGPDVTFETRPIGVSSVETVQPVMVEDVEYGVEEPVVQAYPAYYREYRPVSGVVQGAETAAEGVVEGTAQAVRSVIP